MKRRLIVLLTLSIPALVSGYLFAVQSNGSLLESISPNGTYKVIFERHKNQKSDRPRILLRHINMVKNSEFESESPIYYEGAFDPAFETYYPNHGWLKENVFWLGYKLENSRHSIKIINHSGGIFPKIKIKTEDLFFVFDLPVDNKLTLPLRWTDNGRTSVHFTISATYPSEYKVVNKDFAFPRAEDKEYVISILADDISVSEARLEY